jgi:hypothetical protein
MKSIYGCLMVLLLTVMPGFAQEQAPSADDIVSKMQSKLNLTSDQVTAITPIIEKYTSKRQELKQGVEDGTIERSDMRNQMKQMRADEKQELSQILSADQISQWEQMQSQMRKHREDGDNASAQQ